MNLPGSAQYIHSIAVEQSPADGVFLYYDATSNSYKHAHDAHANLTDVSENLTHDEIDTAVGNSVDHIAAGNPHSGSASTTDLTTHTGAANPHSGSASTTALSDHTGAANPHSGSAAIAHEATHIEGGSAEIDGDKISISYTGWAAIVPNTDAAEVDSVTQLTAILDAIDTAIDGYVGGGEANTMSNDGGEVALFETKSVVDFPMRSLPSDLYEVDTKILWPKVAIPAVDSYCPLPIQYVDASNVKVLADLYWLQGHRLYSQYVTQYCRPITVASPITVDLTSASLIGGKVNESHYGLYLLDGTTVVALPFLRVDYRDFPGVVTRINPAAHADGTTAANGFVDADDCFNGYRLVLLNVNSDYHGSIYTIADTIDGSPDHIDVTGDITAEVQETEWLQMIPASGTDYLFLGTIHFDGSGDLDGFTRIGWKTVLDAAVVVAGNKDTSLGNTDLGTVIPPTATQIGITPYVAGNCYGASCHTAKGTDGTGYLYRPLYMRTGTSNVSNYEAMGTINPLVMTATSLLRNMFRMWTGSWVAATTGDLYVFEYEE